MNSDKHVSAGRLADMAFWAKRGDRRVPLSVDLEITARCNNDCRHCYINLPAGDVDARRKELSLEEIADIVDQAEALGTIFCTVTGGEPLLRADFADVYMMLRKKGLLVSLFTNACLVTPELAALLKRYPPRETEVTVYGATEQTYERVTRRPGSYAAFRRGLDLLLDAGLRVRLKGMALRSNAHELPEIAAFCRARTFDYFRFDPLMHLRHDGNPERNAEIRSERLSPEEVVAIEQADTERANALRKDCDNYIMPEMALEQGDSLFQCGAGLGSFVVSYDGIFRLCADLWHPDTVYDLRKGTLAEAWNVLVPAVREMRSHDAQFLSRCRRCPITNLCLWCPAHAHLETGQMDGFSQYFCDVAHARARALAPDYQDPVPEAVPPEL